MLIAGRVFVFSLQLIYHAFVIITGGWIIIIERRRGGGTCQKWFPIKWPSSSASWLNDQRAFAIFVRNVSRRSNCQICINYYTLLFQLWICSGLLLRDCRVCVASMNCYFKFTYCMFFAQLFKIEQMKRANFEPELWCSIPAWRYLIHILVVKKELPHLFIDCNQITWVRWLSQ